MDCIPGRAPARAAALEAGDNDMVYGSTLVPGAEWGGDLLGDAGDERARPVRRCDAVKQTCDMRTFVCGQKLQLSTRCAQI